MEKPDAEKVTGYRAVLFDMDGTLLDTVLDIGLSANRILKRNGFPQHPLDDYRFFVGRGAEHLIREALPPGVDTSETVDRCLREFLADYSRNWKKNTRPYPGVVEMLNAFTKLGFRMAILSNKPHEITVSCYHEFLYHWDFDIVWGLHDAIPRKPNPAGALKIAGQMSLEPTDFIYLGDTRIDMETAVACGMLPVGVLWGFRPRSELEEAGARLLIETPMELFDHLSEI